MVEEGTRTWIVLQRQHCRWCQPVGESHTELFHIFIETKREVGVSLGTPPPPSSFWRGHSDGTESTPGKQNAPLFSSGTIAQLSCVDRPAAVDLGELKAGVHANSVAQFVAQDALLAVVGQFEQVEACRRSGKSTAGLLLANGEEPSENAAQGVSSVLEGRDGLSVQPYRRTGPAQKKVKNWPQQWVSFYLIVGDFHTADGERWFEVGKTQKRWPWAACDKL